MNLSVRVLGTEVLAISTDKAAAQPEGACDTTTYPVGFTNSPGDQRWETGVEQ